jgi:hypothetical protein
MRQRVVGKEGVVCGAFYRVAGGEVRGRRRPVAVGFELIGFDIDSGRGVDGAPSLCGRGKAARRRFDPAPSECGRGMDGSAQSGGNRPDGRRWLRRRRKTTPGGPSWAERAEKPPRLAK